MVIGLSRETSEHSSAMFPPAKAFETSAESRELSQVSAESLVAPGLFSKEQTADVIQAIQSGDETTLALIKNYNKVVTQAQTMGLASDQTEDILNDSIRRLNEMGVPQSVIDHQIQMAIQAQEQLAREKAADQARYDLFQSFLSDIHKFNQDYIQSRNGSSRENLVIDLNLLFGTFYSIPEIKAQLPGLGMTIEIQR